MKVSHKIALFASIIVVLAFSIFSWVQYHSVRDALYEKTATGTAEATQALGQQITNWLNGKLALIDMMVGIVPGIGTLLDIFIRPSRKTLGIVHEHLHDEYGITETMHMDRPFLHQSLEDKQQQSRFGFFWRNPIVAWLYLHIPDFLGLLVIVFVGWGLWALISWLVGMFGQSTGFG